MKFNKVINRSRIFFINLLIFFIILIVLETLSVFLRFTLNKSFVGYLIRLDLIGKVYGELNNPCNKMVTHPILGQIHSDKSCKVKNGYSIGQYVLYGDKKQNQTSKKVIITLGGSTTDGHYQNFANGITWPNELSKKISKNNKNYSILNGGVGGYGSSKELMKLILDTPIINRDKDIKFVISLNGINELPGYRYKTFFKNNNKILASKFPILNGTNLKIITSRKYPNQSPPSKIKIFPALNTALIYIVENSNLQINNKLSKKLENRLKPFELPYSDYSNKDHYLEAANQWFNNVKIMNAVAKANGAKYFVFLQPTMGLKDYQIPKDKKSRDFEIYKNVGGKDFDYFNDINALYDQLKLKCNQLEFCFDISNLAPPTGNFYNDFRHHNQNGNKIIADHIYKIVFQAPL